MLKTKNRFQVVYGVLLNMNFSFVFEKGVEWSKECGKYEVLFNCFVYNSRFTYKTPWVLAMEFTSLCYSFCLFIIIFRIRIFANIIIVRNDLGNYKSFWSLFSNLFLLWSVARSGYYLQKHYTRNSQ